MPAMTATNDSTVTAPSVLDLKGASFFFLQRGTADRSRLCGSRVLLDPSRSSLSRAS